MKSSLGIKTMTSDIGTSLLFQIDFKTVNRVKLNFVSLLSATR